MFGKTPREISAHPWSELKDWLDWAGLVERQ
jgi:hypothetical protein